MHVRKRGFYLYPGLYRQLRHQEAERERKIYFIVLFYLFISLPTVTLPHHTVSMFSGAGSVISLGGAEQSSIARGALKGALWRRGWGSLLGDPSQSFSDETESARSSPESSPPVVGRKCFLKCSYNTLSQQATTHTHIHTFLWLIQISTYW